MSLPTPIQLRPATAEDASFLALCLMEALGGQVMEGAEEGISPSLSRTLEVLTRIVLRDDTLYSWHFGTVAHLPDGTPVAASIAYPGAEYHQRRLVSFALASELITFDPSQMEDESREGEYYLDTLAVLPAHRRQGIGRLLLREWLRQASALGLRATLICATDNHKAHNLYRSLGLRDAGPVFVFGENYLRMTL